MQRNGEQWLVPVLFKMLEDKIHPDDKAEIALIFEQSFLFCVQEDEFYLDTKLLILYQLHLRLSSIDQNKKLSLAEFREIFIGCLMASVKANSNYKIPNTDFLKIPFIKQLSLNKLELNKLEIQHFTICKYDTYLNANKIKLVLEYYCHKYLEQIRDDYLNNLTQNILAYHLYQNKVNDASSDNTLEDANIATEENIDFETAFNEVVASHPNYTSESLSVLAHKAAEEKNKSNRYLQKLKQEREKIDRLERQKLALEKAEKLKQLQVLAKEKEEIKKEAIKNAILAKNKSVIVGDQCIFVISNNILSVCGSNKNGKIGLDSLDEIPMFIIQATFPKPVISVACGVDSNMVLLSDGSVWSAGDDIYGQLGQASVGPCYCNSNK